MLPDLVQRSVDRHLAGLDRLVPGWVTGFYVVGSTALGAYREERSDIDFVAVVEGDLDAPGLRRVRQQFLRSGAATGWDALRHGRSPMSGTCNGIYVRRSDLPRPVDQIQPVALHHGHVFSTGPAGSDVSPVAWKVWAERGVAVRGPEPSTLGLDGRPEALTAWNLDNLERYWRPWARRTGAGAALGFRARPRWSTAWGALGAPRLLATIATGEIIGKEAAGLYALDVLDARHHPVLLEALAFWRGEPERLGGSIAERRRRTNDLVLDVVEAARQRSAAPAPEAGDAQR